VKGARKLGFGNVRSYSLLTSFFLLMNEEKGWITFQKKFTENFSEKSLFFRNFDNILVRKALLDFNLSLKKQDVMFNSNTFQPNVNTFVNQMISDDSTEKIIKLFFTKVVVVCSAKLLITFLK